MKKILYIILLLPIFVQAQTTVTVKRNATTKMVTTFLNPNTMDTLVAYSGGLTDNYILKWDNSIKRAVWINPTSIIPTMQTLTLGYGLTGTSYNGSSPVTATADTTEIQTVSNFFPKGDTRYLRGDGTANSVPYYTATRTLAVSPIKVNGDSLTIGEVAGTGSTALYGDTYLKHVSLGLVSDSMLVVRNGRIFKVAATSMSYIPYTGADKDLVSTYSVKADSLSGNGDLINRVVHTFGNENIAGIKTFTNTPLFTSTYALGQATFGSTGQGAKINLVEGGGGASNGLLGYASGTSGVLALTNFGQIEISSTNTSGILGLRATGNSGRLQFRTGATQNAEVFSTGNWLLQQGGTFTDAGYKLDVTGTGRYTSTLTANSFVKSGGTSAQFLMANGSTKDTTQIQTVSNFFPKGDTRYLRGTGTGVASVTGTANQITATGTTTTALSIPSTFIAPGSVQATTIVETGSTGTAGKISFRRSSDGVIASSVEQVNDNKLTLTSSGGSRLLDISADRIDFNSSGTTATYWFGQNRPTSTEVKINGSNNNKLILQNNEVDIITLNSNGGTLTASSFGSSGDVILGANNAGLAGKITVGSGLSLTSGVLTATGGSSGSVTTAGGTAGRIVKFTSASNVENSIITEAGSVISIAGDAETSGTNGFSSKSLLIGTDGTIANYRWQTSLSGNDEIFASRSFGTVRTTNYTSGATIYSGAISATNLSGTNTGDQTTITGNAGTATALQTARNIQGVSFNGTADINPINGTGFVKASGTTLSYDNSTYLTGNQTITLSGAVTGSGATSISTTLASGVDATKIADGTVTNAEFQYINTLSSNAQTQLDSKAPLASPALTGSPTAPTQTAGDNSTKIATTAYVDTKFASTSSRVLKDWYTDANNVTTTETDLYDYTVPANTLANNGDKLTFDISGIYAINSNDKEIRLYFGLSDFGYTVSQSSGSWSISGTIIKTGATTYRLSISRLNGSNSLPIYYDGTVTNYTSTNIFKITGLATSSADITAKMGYLEFKPAAL